MEEKYINKILNFADKNINTAKELVINKEQANGIIKELQEDYTPNAIIRFGVRIDIWTHFMRGCIIDYVH